MWAAGYGLGTSLTEVRGHRLHRGDALDANECDGTAAEVRGGLRKRPVVDDGALRAVRCDAADRLQVGGPLSGGGQPGDDRAKPGAARVPASDAGEDRGADPHRPHGVRMGSEEAPAGAPDARARDRMAGAQYRQRHPRAARQAPQAPASPQWTHPGAAPLETQRPNQVWPADFKGQFKTRDGQYCYPLTVTDHFSRTLLVCRGLSSVKTEEAKPVFRALFREVGLPEAIRTDNGTPFASTGIHGLCGLNVWWMQLGIVHQRIHPASPQENATHERMHRELKRETARPAANTLRGQQRKFDAFRRRYNEERPHEGIGDQVPASLWEPSPRPYPERIVPPEYPDHMEIRRVSHCGTFRLHSAQPFLSNALRDQHIGLEEVADGIWNIVYYRTLLGRIDERTHLITGV